jgi:hypothetical protein
MAPKPRLDLSFDIFGSLAFRSAPTMLSQNDAMRSIDSVRFAYREARQQFQ